MNTPDQPITIYAELEGRKFLEFLRQEIKDQLRIYLPNLLIIDVQIETYGTTLAIFISSEKTVEDIIKN